MEFRRLAKALKNSLIYYFLYFFITLLNLLPREEAFALGGWLGSLAYLFLPKDKRTTKQNLKHAFPHLSAKQIDTLSRQTFINWGKSAADVVRFKQWKDEHYRDLVSVDGLERVHKALGMGKGVIGLSGHIGAFELIPVYFTRIGVKIAVVGRGLYDPRLDRLLVRIRESLGVENIPSDASAKAIIQALRAGKGVGILIDQNSSRVTNLQVDFFGRKANTPKGPFALACKVSCPLIPHAVVRVKNDKYKIVFGEILLPKEESENEQIRLAQEANLFLERIIREYPEQWVWMHKRWS